MEINSALNTQLNILHNVVSNETSAENTLSSPLLSLPESVKAIVANLIRDELTLSLPDGSSIIAKAADLKNLAIGLEAEFILSTDNLGNIIAKLSESNSMSSNIASSVISDALNSLGIKPSSENINTANLLLQNEFPVTKENFTMLNRALKMTDNSPDKAMFFMNNNVNLTSKSVQQLNSYINHETKLTEQLNNIVDTIKIMPDSDLKQKLLSLFSSDKTAENETNTTENKTNTAENKTNTAENKPASPQILTHEKLLNNANTAGKASNSAPTEDKASIAFASAADKAVKSSLKLPETSDEEIKQPMQHEKSALEKSQNETLPKSVHSSKTAFSINAKKLSSENVDKFFTKLSETLETAEKLISSSKSDFSQQLSENINSIKENIDFMSSMRNTSFIQLPVTINNTETTADLYVFNNKKNRHKSSGKSANALLALDLAFLGHLEVYIQKNNSNINCQFRLDDDNIQTLIKSNTDKLSSYLDKYNLKLIGCSFKTLDTPFSITDNESSLSDSSLENEIKNITFDMRT